MSMAFEKAASVILCIQKKFYAYNPYDKDGNPKLNKKGELHLETKGIVLNRRDIAPWIKNTYEPILRNIMTNGNFTSSLSLLISSFTDLIEQKISLDDLTIVRQLGNNYVNNNYFMKVFSDQLALSGRPAVPGERLEYIITRAPEGTKLGIRMKIPSDVKGDTNLTPDSLYYIHLIRKSIQRLIVTGHINEIKKIPDNLGYKPPGRRHFIPMKKIINMMYALVRDGYHPEILNNWIQQLNKIIV